MTNFYKIAELVHNDRVTNQRREQERKQHNGETIYAMYCVWCNAFKGSKGKNDYKQFLEYMKEENVEVSFWQFKKIAENHFNFYYEYDANNKKWNIKRKVC